MRKIELHQGAIPFYYSGNSIGCLLLHGLTGTPFEMRWLGEHLHAQGYTVYGPRLPGHGTDPDDLRHISWREWYSCALDGYHMLRRQCDEVFVMGLSMGGVLTLLLAANEPVDGLATFSTPYDLQSQVNRPLRSLIPLIPTIMWAVPTISKGGTPESANAFEQYVRDEQIRRGEEPAGRGNYTTWVTAAVWELYKMLREMRSSIAQITAPTLLIHSKSDHTVPLSNSQRLFNGLGTSDKELIILEESNHNITIHTEHQFVFQTVASFITEKS